MGCIPSHVNSKQFRSTNHYTPTLFKKESVDNREGLSFRNDNNAMKQQNKKIENPHTILRRIDGKLIKKTIDYTSGS